MFESQSATGGSPDFEIATHLGAMVIVLAAAVLGVEPDTRLPDIDFFEFVDIGFQLNFERIWNPIPMRVDGSDRPPEKLWMPYRQATGAAVVAINDGQGQGFWRLVIGLTRAFVCGG